MPTNSQLSRHSPTQVRCEGTLGRRAFVRSGVAGVAGLSLADLLRAEADAGSSVTSPKSIIVVWLWGGASHLETFDLKPDAPSEYRGEFQPIATNVPGIEISEHLPLLAGQADKFSLVRSLHHDMPGHVSATHRLLTGYPGEIAETNFKPRYPFVWSVANKVLGPRRLGLPGYVGLPSIRYDGSAHLGSRFDAMMIGGDPNSPNFQPPSLAVSTADRSRLSERSGLIQQFDAFRRSAETSGMMSSLDAFQQQALDILTSDAARRAFDIHSEDPKVRDRYGRHEIGQRCLLARRLVEAGTRVVSIDFPCVPGQKAFSWDDHASVWNIFEQMKIRLPVLDQVVSALIEDLHARGMHDTLVLVTGEMSHTPKLGVVNGSPGREHWSQAMSLLLAGGGLKMGQVVGETNSKGEEPKRRPVTPGDFLATLYQNFGIPLDTHFTDQSGRPVPLLPNGQPIDELL